MDIKRYLARMNYHGSLAPTAETLKALQLAHLMAVPFENLSVHAGEPIVLDDEALFTKIVEHRRGGFCYEANGLFAALLRTLGFEVAMLSAEVAQQDNDFGAPFDHMTLMVTLEQRWLVDVGFGDSFREPLRLDEPGEQGQHGRAYRIDHDGPYRVLMQQKGDENWKAQYRFTLKPHEYGDYAGMCRYHQTSPQSPFTGARLCTRATEGGRITLSERRLITTFLEGGKRERTLADEKAYAAALREHFGIVMTE
ncbi:acetyltransferase [Kushneria pakistanensis]|uniref:Acetyltransferase n=1 Tax=Kushneria pakistanensis TaxID=1508770 RepID=A0ABQ3FFT3_9GAMM|nr:arylamine N-acetyltransferase [Kushneria pakistanensis]GHC21767.1 acetyltransferase [Kushneria pakistanensis]